MSAGPGTLAAATPFGDDALARSLVTRLRTSDHWRSAPGRRQADALEAAALHKEWQHFCVFDREVELLANWSVMDGVQTRADTGGEVPRVAVLARDASGWVGELERFEPGEIDVRPGGVSARFGPHRMALDDRGYRLSIALRSGALRAELAFEPLATPALTNNVPLAFGGTIRWLIVPRLRVHGEIRVRDRLHRIDGALGYHDHNWGPFHWGADFAWDWAIALPERAETPWSVVLTRLTDRGRLRSISDGLLLWCDHALVRGFRGAQVEVESQGRLRTAERPLRVPRAAWLASAGESSPAPERYVVRARGGGDRLDLVLEARDVAQIAIPNDAPGDDGLSLLTEVHARATVEGEVRGRRVAFEGPALLELIHVER